MSDDGLLIVLVVVTISFVFYLYLHNKRCAEREERADLIRRKEEGVIVTIQKLLGLDPSCFHEISITGRKILKDAGITEVYHGMRIPCYTGERERILNDLKVKCSEKDINLRIVEKLPVVCW